MVKDHSLPPIHELLFSINNKGSSQSTDKIAHTAAYDTQVVEHWLVYGWRNHTNSGDDDKRTRQGCGGGAFHPPIPKAGASFLFEQKLIWSSVKMT